LQLAYPKLKREIPSLELWILGGEGAPRKAAQHAMFQQAGVTVFDLAEDVRPFLDACALTINPLRAVRGSCVKVIESLGAGRICVSTREGARGFDNPGLSALITVENVEDFVEPIEELLGDPLKRRSLEAPQESVLEQYTWKHAGDLLVDLCSRAAARGGLRP
jgi:glycosyltransferase involved in cell wall biosynthesis